MAMNDFLNSDEDCHLTGFDDFESEDVSFSGVDFSRKVEMAVF